MSRSKSSDSDSGDSGRRNVRCTAKLSDDLLIVVEVSRTRRRSPIVRGPIRKKTKWTRRRQKEDVRAAHPRWVDNAQLFAETRAPEPWDTRPVAIKRDWRGAGTRGGTTSRVPRANIEAPANGEGNERQLADSSRLTDNWSDRTIRAMNILKDDPLDLFDDRSNRSSIIRVASSIPNLRLYYVYVFFC